MLFCSVFVVVGVDVLVIVVNFCFCCHVSCVLVMLFCFLLVSVWFVVLLLGCCLTLFGVIVATLFELFDWFVAATDINRH